MDNLQSGAETLLEQYLNVVPTPGRKPLDPGKLTAAMYGYLYALGCRDMLECEADQITPVRINSLIKQEAHYTAHTDAKICVEHIARYLRQPGPQTVYHGLSEGFRKLHAAPAKTVMERELAAYLGVAAFKIATDTTDPALLKAAVESIEDVANNLTKMRLREEMRIAGLLTSYDDHLKQFKDDEKRKMG